MGDSWQISVSSVTTEDNLTWYFTAAEDLPAEGVLRFSEMCYITQGDEGDFVNVTSIENGKKLPATHPGAAYTATTCSPCPITCRSPSQRLKR